MIGPLFFFEFFVYTIFKNEYIYILHPPNILLYTKNNFVIHKIGVIV